MTQTEDRLRSGLEAEAAAITKAARAAQPSTKRRKARLAGAGVAFAVAALVLAVFVGLSLLTDGEGGVVTEPPPTIATVSPSSDTSVPSTIADRAFAAVPFAGSSWQFIVTEEMDPSSGVYEICFGLDQTGDASDAAGFGPPWCDDWPKSNPGISPYLLGVHHAVPSESSLILVIELNDQPVNRVTVTGDGIDETITPYVLPGSGKQFAVVEVPQTAGPLTVEALDQSGEVLAQQEGMCGGDPFQSGDEVCPDFQGTVAESGNPIDDSTVSEIALSMGGTALTDEELERINGSPLGQTGYRIQSVTSGAYELGLIVYQEQPLPLGPSLICFSPYAMTRGVNVAGGAVCADSLAKAEELADFRFSIGGSCGPIPKEQPVIDGIWTHLGVWGVPDTAETVSVGLGDGTMVEVDTQGGVALQLWEESVDIIFIEFAGMTQGQRDIIESIMPARGIGSDCGRSGDGSG